MPEVMKMPLLFAWEMTTAMPEVMKMPFLFAREMTTAI